MQLKDDTLIEIAGNMPKKAGYSHTQVDPLTLNADAVLLLAAADDAC